MAGKAKVEVDLGGLLKLRQHPEQVLRGLDRPCLDGVRRALDTSAFLVPRGGAPDDPLNLADTGFVLGPSVNLGAPLSTTWFSGYSHPAAGAIEAGFHFGAKTRTAPDFMRRAMRGVRALVRKGVAKQVILSISQFLSQK
jgi:hypothetical protein